MTHQLTKEQIDAIKVELRKYGLNVLPMPGRGRAKQAKPIGDSELDKRIARVSAMKFKTAGVKTAMLRSLKTLQRARDYRAANPYDLTTILGWFGVKLQQVQPWPDFTLAGSDQRWQALRNAHTMPVLRLPAPRPD